MAHILARSYDSANRRITHQDAMAVAMEGPRALRNAASPAVTVFWKITYRTRPPVVVAEPLPFQSPWSEVPLLAYLISATEMAVAVGITERAVQRIVLELEEAGHGAPERDLGTERGRSRTQRRQRAGAIPAPKSATH